jgi:hypothetical protein
MNGVFRHVWPQMVVSSMLKFSMDAQEYTSLVMSFHPWQVWILLWWQRRRARVECWRRVQLPFGLSLETMEVMLQGLSMTTQLIVLMLLWCVPKAGQLFWCFFCLGIISLLPKQKGVTPTISYLDCWILPSD